MFFSDYFAGFYDVFGFIGVEGDFGDHFVDVIVGGFGRGFSVGILFKEIGSCFVYQGVCALGGHDCADQELEGSFEV